MADTINGREHFIWSDAATHDEHEVDFEGLDYDTRKHASTRTESSIGAWNLESTLPAYNVTLYDGLEQTPSYETSRKLEYPMAIAPELVFGQSNETWEPAPDRQQCSVSPLETATNAQSIFVQRGVNDETIWGPGGFEHGERAFRRPSSEPPPEKARTGPLRRRADENEWSRMRPIIEELYGRMSLKKTRDFMEEEHGFKASPTAYKARLKEWGSKKNVPKDVAVYMWRRAVERKNVEGKATMYRYCGVDIPIHKVKRAGYHGSETLSIRSTPSELSVITPTDNNKTSPNVKKRPFDDVCSKSTTTTAETVGQPSGRNKVIMLHQRDTTQILPKDTIQQDSASLIDRLEAHSYHQRALSDELSLLPLAQLCELARTFTNRSCDWSSDLVFENILGHEDYSSINSKSASHSFLVPHVKALLSQRKFWTVRMVLKGICAEEAFQTSTQDHRLKIHKLNFLAEAGEHLGEPKHFESLEDSCMTLIQEQNLTQYRPDHHWPKNLILAYLMRLYGIHGRELEASTISVIKTTVQKQFDTDKPSRSLIWIAQQYARWCYMHGQSKEASQVLENVARVVGNVCTPTSAESAQTTVLQEFSSSISGNVLDGSTAPDVVDLYAHSQVDAQCLEAFRGYLWDNPYPYTMNQARKTKISDGEYYY